MVELKAHKRHHNSHANLQIQSVYGRIESVNRESAFNQIAQIQSVYGRIESRVSDTEILVSDIDSLGPRTPCRFDRPGQF